MIKHIKINNFKSIKEAELDCGRVNIFIGEPNSGKTNIIEGIGLLSTPYSGRIEHIARFEELNNLFYDNSINDNAKIEFKIEEYLDTSISKAILNSYLSLTYNNNEFVLKYEKNFEIENHFKIIYKNNKWAGSVGPSKEEPVRFYEFYKYKVFKGNELNFLYPPFGKNLLEVLKNNSDLREFAKNLLDNYGYNLLLEPEKNKIRIAKVIDGILISQPFYTLADTLQRILFYTAVIETNKDSTIVLDEPDVYLFPKYTKYLAERIAKYNSNQFFLTTHNPYFLLTLAEKTPEKDLRIFLTYFEDYQTKVKLLSPKEVLDLRDEDASLFFNLEKYKD